MGALKWVGVAFLLLIFVGLGIADLSANILAALIPVFGAVLETGSEYIFELGQFIIYIATIIVVGMRE